MTLSSGKLVIGCSFPCWASICDIVSAFAEAIDEDAMDLDRLYEGLDISSVARVIASNSDAVFQAEVKEYTLTATPEAVLVTDGDV